MKTRLPAALGALLLGIGLLPMAAQAAAPATPPANASIRDSAAPRADQCSPAGIARLSAAIEEARTAWAEALTPASFDSFRQARDLFAARSSACSRSVSGDSRPITSAPASYEPPSAPQSINGAPIHVPVNGIAVDIRSTGDQVIAGLDVAYAVTVTTGSGDAADSTNVSVAVTLPVAVDGPQYLDDTGGCSFATPTLTCALGTIARAGASKSFLVRMSTPPDLFFDGTTTLAATASVTRTEADSISADNTDTSSTLVTEQSDLRAFKYMLPSSPVAGELAQYTIYVENRGPSTARNVTMRDTLLAGPADSTPAPVTIQSCAFSVSQGGGSITQFTCTTGPVVGTQFGTDEGTFSTDRLDPLDFDVPAPNPSDPDLVHGRVRGSFRLLFNRDITAVNTLAVESSTPDPDYSNNNATTFSDVLAASDLALTKSATGEEQQINQAGLMFNNAVFAQAFPTAPNYFSSTRVTAGRRIQYTLTVTNPGNTLAENVVLTDRLPAGVHIYQGSLAVSKVVLPSTTSSGGGTCVTGTPGDPTDPLVCALGAIRPAGTGVGDPLFDPSTPISKTVTFQVLVDADVAAGTVLENDATVSSDGLELDNSNNYAFTQNTVLAAGDLQALKTSTGQNLVFVSGHYVYQDLANQVTAGYVLRSSITVQNNGPSDSQYVTIQDQLPDVLAANGVMPLTFLRAENADCRPDAVHARDVFCSLGTLAAGERRTFDIYTQANEDVPDGTVIQNCATALSGGSNTSPPGPSANPPTGGPTGTLTWDPLTSDNQSCTSVTVNHAGSSPAQGLAIDKSGPTTADVGQNINYTLTVSNSGPGSANNVVASDFLPAELRNVVATPSQGACNTGVPGDSGHPLMCNLGTVPAGASATIGVAAQITPTLLGGWTMFNDAQVTSTSGDPDNSDNIDTVATSINLVTKPDGRIRKGSGKFIGDNIYNTDGTNQAKTGAAARHRTITFRIQAQNDGPNSDSFTITATGAATTQYTVKYFHGKTDITAAVVAGTYTTPVLAPGDNFLIRAKVKVTSTATVGSSVTRLVTITSVGNGSNQDAVMFTAKRK